MLRSVLIILASLIHASSFAQAERKGTTPEEQRAWAAQAEARLRANRALLEPGGGAEALEMERVSRSIAAGGQDLLTSQAGKSGGAAIAESAPERDEILSALGYAVNEADLFIFVSESMPPAMIEAYQREAVWAGGIVILRGTRPGASFADFIKEVGQRYVAGKGATATMQIDPRLFDKFGIERVPAIVWDEQPFDMDHCRGSERVEVDDGRGKTQPIEQCRPAKDDTFYKITGGVTIGWALEQFAEAGSVKARRRLDKMREFVGAGGRLVDPIEPAEPFEMTPDAEAALRAEAQRVTDLQRLYEAHSAPLYDDAEYFGQ